MTMIEFNSIQHLPNLKECQVIFKFGNARRLYAKPQIRGRDNFWFMLMILGSRWSAVGIKSRPRAGRSGVRTTVEARDFSQWNVTG